MKSSVTYTEQFLGKKKKCYTRLDSKRNFVEFFVLRYYVKSELRNYGISLEKWSVVAASYPGQFALSSYQRRLGTECDSANFPNKLDRWRHIRNRRGQLGTRLLLLLFVNRLFAPCKGVWIPESRKFLLVESEIVGLRIWNTAQGIRNPTNDCNPESKFY